MNYTTKGIRVLQVESTEVPPAVKEWWALIDPQGCCQWLHPWDWPDNYDGM